MSNVDRLALVRERLTPCQVALRELQRSLADGSSSQARVWAAELFDAFLDLEAATGAVSTPAALFDMGPAAANRGESRPRRPLAWPTVGRALH